MKKFLLIISFQFLIPISAQELNEQQLDSLYNKFLRMNGIIKDVQQNELETDPASIKCGFRMTSQIKFNLERFSFERQQLLKSLLVRPTRDTSIVSLSGRFRIHFNLIGSERPNYDPFLSARQNAEEVGKAIDSAYNFEVNFLGYPAAPFDNGEGGDNLYDIYITSAAGNYGFTQPEISLGDQKYTSHIQIHYSFQGQFYTHGFDAMSVTVAHEYHHAIQIGNYTGDRIDQDGYFYEITSTSMEEFVYDNVNDYYAYMPTYFNNTSVSFGNTQGYELAIWNIFLDAKFGHNIIKRQWELLPEMRALNAINAIFNLPAYGLNFRDVLHEFAIWTFFTKYRAKQNEYFEEAASYPLVQPIISPISFQSPDEKVTINDSKSVANSFITFINAGTNPDDTITVLTTNGDYINGVENPSFVFPFEYTLYDYNAPGTRKLNENFNYYALFNTSQPSFWSNSEFLNSDLISTYKFIAEYDYAFPSPFRYGLNTFIFIPVTSPESDDVDLNIYTSSMDLVYSERQVLTRQDNQPGVRWNVLDNDGQKLASGVYIYAIKSGDKTSIGKLVIFNE
jgi:hypothetical protein